MQCLAVALEGEALGSLRGLSFVGSPRSLEDYEGIGMPEDAMADTTWGEGGTSFFGF
jgi:hypothetical protein